MKIITSVKEMNAFADEAHALGKKIGLVPTMGYLHDGHLSLIKKSVSENDVTVVSVFVNPTQFAPNEDFKTYPRDLNRDAALAESVGADAVFHPEPEEMYPDGYHTYISVEKLTEVLCGVSRPTHFRGVTTVVAKLFNIARADRAYFGQKDAQQLAVVRRMVADLNMNIEIVGCPIVRESDGLALSSRNVFLSPDERSQALVLYKSLRTAKGLLEGGERSAARIRAEIERVIKTAPLADIDYIEIVRYDDLTAVETIDCKVLIALAVRFGKTRLIDNIIF